MDFHQTTPTGKPRLTAFGRNSRRERIFDRLRQGWSYETIGAAERLSEKHVRKIVGKCLRKREVDETTENALLQLIRLQPAMQLTAEAVANGDLKAVAPLLRVLDRYDRYQPAARASQVYDDEMRQKLLAKLNRMAAAAREESLRKRQVERLKEAWADSSLAEDEPASRPEDFFPRELGVSY